MTVRAVADTIQPVFETTLGKLYHADCMDLLPTIASNSIDLIFADPPFNLGKEYGNRVNDNRPDEEYLSWCKKWIDECIRILVPGGSFFLYNLPKWNISLGSYLGENGLTFRHWITIDIKFGLPIPGRLYPSHYSLLYYTKGTKPKTFLRPRVPIPVCRHCGGEIKDYGGHRDKLNKEGLNLTDVWNDIPPVRHKSTKNRQGNELSLKLLQRVLTIASVEGDVVFDPFGGGGSTYEAAEKMNRFWIGSEIQDCDPIVKRLKRMQKPLALFSPENI
ncbi:MAG TPA: site-specific DNA-methyltransferase [Chloroflexia bacterium]|nr:site-specific DNA-methyltransferase [Chloroflexia bacterium]